MRKLLSLTSFALLVALVGLAMAQTPNAPPKLDTKAVAFFETNIRPLLVKHCDTCHSNRAKQVMGGLKLDSHAAWRRGGATGPVIVPGDPEKSPLIAAVRYRGKPMPMPPAGKLSDKEIDLLVTWVKMGVPDPRGHSAPATKTRGIDIAQGRRYWAFQPLRRIAPPKIKNKAWTRTLLDNFILAKLEAKGLHPNPPADRSRLIRRVAFDMLGLPPTPEEVTAFVNDRHPDATPA